MLREEVKGRRAMLAKDTTNVALRDDLAVMLVSHTSPASGGVRAFISCVAATAVIVARGDHAIGQE